MRTFELSERMNKTGQRTFKIILHEIYPDDCIDEANQVGTIYNKNGITWIREYCENVKDTIKDRSLRAEFLDDDRTEICGHGETGAEDGLPIFENADILGHFTNAYIDVVKDEDGTEHTVMIGEGYIDEMCHKNFVAKLEQDIANNNPPFGSVEILRTENNPAIIYKYGYKEKGRIPTEFEYSGYALLGVAPADDQARIVELNDHNEEDECHMTEAEIKALVEQTVNEMSTHTAEINECKSDCEAKIAEANAAVEAAVSEKNEIEASAQQVQAALDDLRKEYEELNKKYDELWEEKRVLETALAEARAKERIAELDEAIAKFTDEQRAYASAEIESFKADPENCEINSVVDKILREIGSKTVEDAANEAKISAEQNAFHKTEDIDIFGDIAVSTNKAEENVSIF